MSFRSAMRAYLFSDSTLTNLLSESGTLGAALTAGAITEITVSGLSTAPDAVGQVLLKNAAGKYEFVDYTAATLDGSDYDLTVSATIVNSYDLGDYVAMCVGVYSFPAPQAASMPYVLLNDTTTDEVLNKLNGPATVVMETWQLSCFAESDLVCSQVKDAVVDAMNLVNPTTWSEDGFANVYTVDTSVFVSHTTIEELEDDGSQTPTIHKPLGFTVKRSFDTTAT